MIIKEKAPVRISFGSSGDSNYFFDYITEGNALSATIDKYAYTEIHPRKDDKIVLRSLETGEVLQFNSVDEIAFDRKELNVMKAVVKHFKNTGIEIITYTDAPLESGLGGSASHAVSLIKAFCRYNNIEMSKDEIAKLAYHIERNVLGIEGGHQDQWAAAVGGFNYIHFEKNVTNSGYPMKVAISPIKLDERDMSALENSMVLIHIPREKSGREVHLEQRSRSEESLAILKMKFDNIESMRRHLENREMERIGGLLHLDWKIKKQMAPSITSDVIDRIYDAALRSGATGGRVIGAGAGGSMLLWCPNRRTEVLNALKEFDVKELPFKIERPVNERVSLKEKVHEKIYDHHKMVEDILNNEEVKERIELIATKIIDSYRHGGKLIVFGNGGSAADAQHIVGELVNKMNIDRPMLNAIALTVNTSVMTAISNDIHYDEVFSRQVESLAQHNDVVIGISTSGKAENVLRAFKKAKERNALVVYFTGKTGGKISELLEKDGTIDISLKIPSTYTPRIQEAHILAGHIICDLVEHELYGK